MLKRNPQTELGVVSDRPAQKERLPEHAAKLRDAEQDKDRRDDRHHATELSTPKRHPLRISRVAGQDALSQQ